MKKLLIIALTTALCAAIAIPASAFESEFGGYWRTRAYDQIDFDGTESGSSALVDTRTRLYYTAKFSDDFKFVNKFEFNNTWGSNGASIGTDATGTFRIKHSYADFNTGAMNFKVGMQGVVLGRGFLFDDDFAGLNATYKAGDNTFSAIWMKVNEEDGTNTSPVYAQAVGIGTTTEEADFYILTANLNLSDTLSVSPYLSTAIVEGADTTVYNLGVDLDMKINDTTSAWATLIYDTGEVLNVDASGYLVAFGADAGVVHGQFFYASGQDSASDIETFVAPLGQAYYWSEIMGWGTFDNQASGGSPGGAVTNIMALNVGTTLKPMDKLTVTADVWYAQLAEDNAAGDADLGVEIDLKATYKVLDNLNLDLIAAYLVAGDATGDEDPIEIGTRLSLSF